MKKVIDYVIASTEYKYAERDPRATGFASVTPRKRTVVTSFEDVVKGLLADGFELYGFPYMTALGEHYQALVKYEKNS